MSGTSINLVTYHCKIKSTQYPYEKKIMRKDFYMQYSLYLDVLMILDFTSSLRRKLLVIRRCQGCAR